MNIFDFKSINRPKEYRDWSEISNYTKFIAEPKFDGIRMLAEKRNGVLTIHREESNIKNSQFPEVLKQLANMPDNTIFDGELCVLTGTIFEKSIKSNFSLMQQRINLLDDFRINILSDKTPATFVAFDCPLYEGVDITGYNLLKRKSYLKDFIHTKEYRPEELLGMIQKNDMEGIVVKDPKGSYKSEWFKFKNYMETNYRISRVISKERNISSLELTDMKTGEIVGSVKWLFDYHQSDKLKKALLDKIAVVRHMLTSKGKIRFPSLQNKDELLRVEQ